uniref:Bm8808 n=1 Tax=Brugia malayi TaxID=6279 RepID=A0A1I9G0B0_BRUMA|nr:Bm8808 [Brugia malayi]
MMKFSRFNSRKCLVMIVAFADGSDDDGSADEDDDDNDDDDDCRAMLLHSDEMSTQ